MHQMMTSRLNFERTRLTKLQSSYPLATPERLYRPFIERLVQMDSSLQNATKLYVMNQKSNLQAIDSKMKQYSPKYQLTNAKQQLAHREEQITRLMQQQLKQSKVAFSNQLRMLEALNPLALMSKGFSIAYKEEIVVKSIHDLKKDDVVHVTFQDGYAKAKIINTYVQKEGES